MIRRIGINCGDEVIDGHLDRLERELARVQQAGFDPYEFSAVAFSVIRNGQIDQAQLDRVKAVLARSSLRYTLHAPCTLRLTDPTGLGQQVFRSCPELAAQIRAEVIVYHSAQIALRAADQDTEELPDADGLRASWQRETAALQVMALEAEERGIAIAVENRDPHLWEFAALKRHGQRAEEIATYHQGGDQQCPSPVMAFAPGPWAICRSKTLRRAWQRWGMMASNCWVRSKNTPPQKPSASWTITAWRSFR